MWFTQEEIIKKTKAVNKANKAEKLAS